VADHHGCGRRVVVDRTEHRRCRAADCAVEVGVGSIPRSRQASLLPEGDGGLPVGCRELANLDRWSLVEPTSPDVEMARGSVSVAAPDFDDGSSTTRCPRLAVQWSAAGVPGSVVTSLLGSVSGDEVVTKRQWERTSST
jgi:hypothetical protein